MTTWLQRRQVALYLGALVLGTLLGLGLPGLAAPAALVINPCLGLLLYVTFLGLPFAQIPRALQDWRFLLVVLAVNFVAVPLVVFALSRFIAHDQVLLVGVLFVLLTPCVDYVIVFTGLAGGARDRLLAAAPLLMVAQMVLLPVLLRIFVGAEFVAAVDLTPFLTAFVTLVVLPLVAAGLTQVAAARTRIATRWADLAGTAMVPLMALTLVVVVASQISAVRAQLGALLPVTGVYLAFAAVMVGVATVVARLTHLEPPAARAVVFSGVTRNSLVVLPLVLALPAVFSLAPLVVITQTLVELVVMVAMVRLVPVLVPSR
ncbi:MAG TPA: arsenic resistance protein [Candidatus Avipropionibacterium avicola]|uniref:Arsenic resistance protein n=1 Tax=Candidatus Avipropionibacterium avicola TaxID=2840701 RepID=A0A9D1GZB3_9ACTN|nr:arsenic resistance protein [Candidatus Avipropionibacterium avicola]